MSQLRLFLTPSDNPDSYALHSAVMAWAISRALDADLVLVLDGVDEQVPKSKPFLEALAWLGVDWDEEPEENKEDSEITKGIFFYSPLGENVLKEIQLPMLVDEQKRPLPQNGYQLEEFQNGGYLPKALFNYFVLLGWTPPSGDEILDKWQIRQQFDPELLGEHPVVFDWDQLQRINHHYIQKLGNGALAEEIRPFLEDAYGRIPMATGWLEKVAALIKPALNTLEDAIEAAEWALSDDFELTDNAETILESTASHSVLSQLVAELATVVLLDEQTAVSIVNGLVKQNDGKHGGTPQAIETLIRAALTGQTDGASLPIIMGILGKQTCLQRVANVLR